MDFNYPGLMIATPLPDEIEDSVASALLWSVLGHPRSQYHVSLKW